MKSIVNNTDHVWVIDSQIQNLNLTCYRIYI